MLMGCSKGSAVRLAPSSLLCAQTVRAGQWLRAGPGLRAWAWDCARGPVDDGVRGAGTVRAGQWTTGCAGLELCARAPLLAALTH